MNRARVPLPIYFVLLTALLLIVGCTSCTRNERLGTIHTSVIAVNAAKDGFVAWDRLHQQAIADQAASKEEALSTLAAYHERRKPVVNTFEVAYQALAVAATQIDELSLKAALTSAATLIDDIRTLTAGKVDIKPQQGEK